MPSRICSTLDCGRVHFAKGLCERCYRRKQRKARKNGVLKTAPASNPSGQHNAANAELQGPSAVIPPRTLRGSEVETPSATFSTSDPAPSSGEEPSRQHRGDVRPAPSGVKRGVPSDILPKGRAALPQVVRPAWN